MQVYSRLIPCFLVVSAIPALHAEPIQRRGRVVPAQHSLISSQVDGILISIVEQGAKVKKGEVLARLDSTEAELELALAEQRLQMQNVEVRRQEIQVKFADAETKVARTEHELARAQFRRFQRLLQSKAVALEEVDQAKLQLERAQDRMQKAEIAQEQSKAELENATLAVKEHRVLVQTAKAHLAKHQIVAPYAGVVLNVAQGLGGSVRAHRKPVLHLASQDRLVVESALPVQLLPQVSETITISFPDLENVKPITGKLTFVSPMVQENRTCVIRVTADQPEAGSIRIGTGASLSVELRK